MAILRFSCSWHASTVPIKDKLQLGEYRRNYFMALIDWRRMALFSNPYFANHFCAPGNWLTLLQLLSHLKYSRFPSTLLKAIRVCHHTKKQGIHWKWYSFYMNGITVAIYLSFKLFCSPCFYMKIASWRFCVLVFHYSVKAVAHPENIDSAAPDALESQLETEDATRFEDVMDATGSMEFVPGLFQICHCTKQKVGSGSSFCCLNSGGTSDMSTDSDTRT